MQPSEEPEDEAEAGWFMIETSDPTCILPSVLLEPNGAGMGWGASLMQRAKARLYMSVSRAPKELPASAFAGDAPLWLLGECCDAQQFRERAASLLWFSYRQGFRPIEPTQLTSDTGWGCVLRVGQMLLANTLARLMRGIGSKSDAARRLIPWFADTPGPSHPYSVHNMAQLGTLFGIKIGEWFQPSIMAKVLKLLVRKYSPFGATFYYAHDRVVYTRNVELLCTATDLHSVHSPRFSAHHQQVEQPRTRPGAGAAVEVEHWRPVIIMAPVRLGVGDAINPMYVASVADMFRLPQCVGIIGGKPNASVYFVGMQQDIMFYLDPHFVQPASGEEAGEQHHASVLCMPVSEMDPCFCVGFLCTTRADFAALCKALAELEARDATTCIISVADLDPDYARRETAELPVDPLSHLVFTSREK